MSPGVNHALQSFSWSGEKEAGISGGLASGMSSLEESSSRVGWSTEGSLTEGSLEVDLVEADLLEVGLAELDCLEAGWLEAD